MNSARNRTLALNTGHVLTWEPSLHRWEVGTAPAGLHQLLETCSVSHGSKRRQRPSRMVSWWHIRRRLSPKWEDAQESFDEAPKEPNKFRSSVPLMSQEDAFKAHMAVEEATIKAKALVVPKQHRSRTSKIVKDYEQQVLLTHAYDKMFYGFEHYDFHNRKYFWFTQKLAQGNMLGHDIARTNAEIRTLFAEINKSKITLRSRLVIRRSDFTRVSFLLNGKLSELFEVYKPVERDSGWYPIQDDPSPVVESHTGKGSLRAHKSAKYRENRKHR